MDIQQMSFIKNAIVYLGGIAIILFLIALIISIIIGAISNIKNAKVEKRLRDEYYYTVHDKMHGVIDDTFNSILNKKDDTK